MFADMYFEHALTKLPPESSVDMSALCEYATYLIGKTQSKFDAIYDPLDRRSFLRYTTKLRRRPNRFTLESFEAVWAISGGKPCDRYGVRFSDFKRLIDIAFDSAFAILITTSNHRDRDSHITNTDIWLVFMMGQGLAVPPPPSDSDSVPRQRRRRH